MGEERAQLPLPALGEREQGVHILPGRAATDPDRQVPVVGLPGGERERRFVMHAYGSDRATGSTASKPVNYCRSAGVVPEPVPGYDPGAEGPAVVSLLPDNGRD